MEGYLESPSVRRIIVLSLASLVTVASLWFIYVERERAFLLKIKTSSTNLFAKTRRGRPTNNAVLLIDGKLYRGVSHSTNLPVIQCFSSDDDRICLPSWIIAAGAKSGSSALWQYLCDNVGSQCSEKEIHYKKGSPLLPYIQRVMGQNESFGSGNMDILEPLNDFIIRHSNAKFIMLLRNPIDWAYAAWHFWCNPLFDGHDCTGWASKATNKTSRTPQSFENLLERYCQNQQKCFADPWRVWNRAEVIMNQLTEGRWIVIRSEELAVNIPSTLDRLWIFLGLPNKLRHPDIVHKAFNTGSKNGVNNYESSQMALGKSYEPMTSKSREILCNVSAYWSRLSYFVNKYQLIPHPVDLEACQV